MELRGLPRLVAARSTVALAALLLWLPAGAWAQGVNLFPPPGTEGSGERELKAFQSAYPDRIGPAVQRDGDWAVQVDGEWFFWAHGRILPEGQRADWERYARYRFYPYPLGGLPPIPQLDDQTAARLQAALAQARLHPPKRSEDFLERLFGAGSRKETDSHIAEVDFLGFQVRAHSTIKEALRAVSDEIEAVGKVDPDVAEFLRRLSEIDGFNYRDVAGTATRSYHSYGLAVDLIPRSYGGRAPYWRWAMEKPGKTDRWWATPYEQRWMVPLSVVSIFERHGFVWGGKWLFFDTMHFEYRPEILILARQKAGS